MIKDSTIPTYFFSSFIAGAIGDDAAPRERPDKLSQNKSKIEIVIAAESVRFFTYLGFWSMVIFAITITKLFVVEKLAAGPETPGDTCGPFNLEVPGPGKGFDLMTQGHLVQFIGYSNICVFWDYTPSRELTAMFYVIMEYLLIAYVIMDFLTVALSHQRGELTDWFWNLTKTMFPIQMILVGWFRMIFVVPAYESLAGHSAGFLGLQISLMLLTIQNSCYVLDSGVSYKFLGGLNGTRICTVVYIICNLAVSAVKIGASMHAVIYNFAAPFTLKPVGSVVVGQIVDWIWMLFNAVIPLFISYVRAKSEHGIRFVLDMEPQKYLKPELIFKKDSVA